MSRQAADGMDSETLLIRDTVPIAVTSNATATRHSNLNLSSTSAVIKKVPSPNFVPHEPVRGAVKAVSINDGGRSMQWNVTPIKRKQTESGLAGNHFHNSNNKTSTPIKNNHNKWVVQQ